MSSLDANFFLINENTYQNHFAFLRRMGHFFPPFHALPGMNDGVGDVIMSVCRRYSSLIFPPKKSPSTHPFIMIN